MGLTEEWSQVYGAGEESRVKSFLEEKMGIGGVQLILGMTRTVGSLDCLPPR